MKIPLSLQQNIPFKDAALIDKIRRKKSCPAYTVYKDKIKYLVYFRIDKVLPLIGDKK